MLSLKLKDLLLSFPCTGEVAAAELLNQKASTDSLPF